MSVENTYNFRVIDDTVATSGLLSEEQLSELRDSGYEAVINLLPHDSQYAIKGEEAIVTEQDIDYLYIPVDFASPTEKDYLEFVNAIKSCEGRKLLIHCAANFRVSAFYSMYAYEYLGWSASQAKEFIESIWCPEDNPPWHQFISNHIPDHG